MAKKGKIVKTFKADSFGFRNKKADEASWWMQYIGGALVIAGCAVRMFSTDWWSARNKEGKAVMDKCYDDMLNITADKMNEE